MNPPSLLSKSTLVEASLSVPSSSHRHFSRKRPVSFGNPALGTYKGNVYTVSSGRKVQSSPSSSSLQQASAGANRPLVENAESVERMVAMIDVPPEHVPEGILSLIRSHRPFIEHVRIVIAENNDEGRETNHNEGEDEDDGAGLSASSYHGEQEELKHVEDVENAYYKVAVSPSIGINTNSTRSSRTYLVLFQMANDGDAATFVEDLDGKPYIAFDDQEVCHVEHVVALEGQDGVSLLNPHFAPSTKTKSSQAAAGTAHLEITSDSISQASSSVKGMSLTTTGPAENCAVCLERMELYDTDGGPSSGAGSGGDDTSKTAILTTVCNHTFHLDCLRQCSGPCPVCRYDHSGLNETLSQCHICGTTEHNYVCLICGVVSCVGVPTIAHTRPTSRMAEGGACTSCSNSNGGYAAAGGSSNRKDGDLSFALGHNAVGNSATAAAQAAEDTAHRFYTSHAGQHYNDTLHAYALDTETQHVYDFAGQGYVHRLVQNKEDGKLVEINDPHSNSQERSLTPGLSDSQEGEVVHRKLEGLASQYYTLLKSQLEQQRTFYEGRLQEIRREFLIREQDHEEAKAELGAALRQERKQLSHRLATMQRRRDKLQSDSAFLKSLNESLEANKPALQLRIQQAQRERIESREMIQKHLPALEEKLTTLMLQLEESMESASRNG